MKKKKKGPRFLSAREFFQLAVNSLLELCVHRVDGHHLARIEGYLILTLDSGDKIALNIVQQNLHSQSKPDGDDGTVESSAPVCYFFFTRRFKLVIPVPTPWQ